MDFGSRISDARNSVNTSRNEYNQYAKEAQAAGGRFNQGMDRYQSRSFGDIYNQARDQYYNNPEVQGARNTYQQARNAVDQMNTTINKMPESIRQQFGGTGLTEAQRQRALQGQYESLANTYNMLNTNYANASNDYRDLADRGLREAMFAAQGNDSRELAGLNALQNAWNTLLSQRNTAYSQNQSDRGLLESVYGARDNQNLAEKQMELERWKQQQANSRAQAELDLQRYLGSRVQAVPRPEPVVSRPQRVAPQVSERDQERSRMYKAFRESNPIQQFLAAPIMWLQGY